MSDALLYLANSAAWSLGGFALGWLIARQRRDVAEIKEVLMTDDEAAQHRPRQRRPDRVMGPFVVIVVCVGAVISGFAASESRDAVDRVERLADCNQDILDRTVQALNERTTLSNKATQIRQRQLRTQARLVDALLDPEARPQVQTRRAREYRDAVRAQLRLDARSAQRRENNPYPTAEQIRDCS